MDNNVYYTGKHSSYMLPPVNYSIPYDSYTEYQASSQVQPQQQQQQQLPHQVQTTHQQHHDIQSTISVKLDTINKSPSQKNDEIQACSGGYTGNNSANDFHGNLYHYTKNLDNGDGIASYNQTSVSSYSDFEHISGSSIGQKPFSSFVIPQQQQQHQQQPPQHQSHNSQQNQQLNQQQIQQTHQAHPQHPPTAAIIPQAIGNVQNDISNQQTKVLGTFDQRTSSKCYNSKISTATSSLHAYQQSGYKDSEMPYKLPPVPQTYHHVYPTYDKYSIQSRPTSHHKSYDDNPVNSRSFVCQTMPVATNHKPTSQPELFCSSAGTTEQHNRLPNRNFLFQNSAFSTPNNSYFPPMYHRSNNVHRNISLPPPLQPAIDDSPSYFHHNNLLVRGSSYNRSQMAFQQSHYPYARSHHPMPIPKLQAKSDIDIMSGLSDDIYHRPYNVSYDHFDDYQYSQLPPTHFPTKSSKVIFAPYNSNSMNSYTTGTTNQQSVNQNTAQQQHQQQPPQQQQQHHNLPPQQHHHQSVIQNQVVSSNDYSRYNCSNVPPSNCSNKVYLQDQYSYATHAQMHYPHGASEVAQTELPKYNQMYDTKHTTPSTDKIAMVDVEEQVTGVKILKTREITPINPYDCLKSNYSKNSYFYNYDVMNNSYQQLRGSADQETSKNQDIRNYITTWNDDEEDESETHGGIKKSNPRRIASVDVMSRSCGQSKLEMDGVPTTKIHFGIKVDNGGVPTKNLPDIIIDIEKPKVVGSDETYSSVADKLYVLESIDVPFSDLNKYKHLSVVNKLPDNIVQIDRRKSDSLDDVEETLKMIEKCEERVRQHKSDFELDVKFDSEPCASPIQADCRSDVEENAMLGDPLSIPVHADQHIVPAPSPTIEPDEEISSNAHDKTADDGQINDIIDKEEDEEEDKEEMETRDDDGGEVVRYKCVQKKVSTNGDDQIHSDDSIPKLKLIKVMRRKRSKSFRNRKFLKSDSDSFDADEEIKLCRIDEEIALYQVKTLKLCCVDVINTNSFRKHLISLKEFESQNVFQYSRHTSIQNNVECCVDETKSSGEPINEVVEGENVSSDLIASKKVNHSPGVRSTVGSDSDDDSGLPLHGSNVHCVDEIDRSSCDELQSTLDNNDQCNKENPDRYDFFRQENTVSDSLSDFKFHTPSVGDDFADPNLDSNFESIPIDLPTVPIKSNDKNDEISPFFSLNNQQTIDLPSVDVDDIHIECKSNITSTTVATEKHIEGSEKCLGNIMDIQSMENIIENLAEPNSIPLGRVDDSEIMESLDELEELIGSTEKTTENALAENSDLSSCPVNNLNESFVAPTTESTDEVNALANGTNIIKTESYYTDSSSSSFSSSDDSNDSDFHTETDVPETKPILLTTNNDNGNNAHVTDNSCTSSEDESEDLDDRSSVSSSGPTYSNNSPTISSSVSSKRNSSEMKSEPKIKIENVEIAVHSKLDDQVIHSPDHEFKSSSYSSSCSDNSDESSSDSDDETVSDSVSNVEKKIQDVHLPFVVRQIKTEPEHRFSDTLTDESSADSCDETECETPGKNISTHDNDSRKSSSSSENSDDEYVSQSPLKSGPTENEVESPKICSETDQSEDEEKKSCSSHHSSTASINEKHDSLSESVTESETCTDSTTATPITITRQNSSTNSNEGNESIEIYSDVGIEKQDDFIKTETEPINDDNYVSSSDNSDDEYVKLSPLNGSPLDECSRIPNHVGKISQLSKKNVTAIPIRGQKPVLSTDGYSSSLSSSSSSSSQSSSSDEDSSDDDEVFETKAQQQIRDVNTNEKINLIESEKTIASEIEELKPTPPNEQKSQEDRENVVKELETLSNVEEVMENIFRNDVAHCNNPEEFIGSPCHSDIMTEHVDELLIISDRNSEQERNSEVLSNEISIDNSMLSIDQINSDLTYDEGSVTCATNDERSSSPPEAVRESSTTQSNDVRNTFNEIEETVPAPSPRTTDDIEDMVPASGPKPSDDKEVTAPVSSLEPVEEPINCNSRDSTDQDDLTDSSETENDESRIENQVVSTDEKCEEPVSIFQNDDDLEDSSKIDGTDSGVLLQSNKSGDSDCCQIMPPVESMDVSDNKCFKETSVVHINKVEASSNQDINFNYSEGGDPKNTEITEHHIAETETVGSIELSHCKEEEKNETSEVETIFSNITEISPAEKSEEKTIENKSILHPAEKLNQIEEISDSIEIVATIPCNQKDLIYPVLDIPVKLIPLPGEDFNQELYQALIAEGQIFPSRKVDEILDFEDFYSKIPVELIPLPSESINESAPLFVEFKRKYLKNQTHPKSEGNVGKKEENAEPSRQCENSQSSVSSEQAKRSTLVIYDSIPSLKVLCEKVLCVAGLHYDEDNENAVSIDGDDENISYLYIVNDSDDFWNCSTESSPPLIVCYDGELEDDVFVESEFTAPIDLPDDQVNISETFSTTSQSVSVDSFTIDSHDIQYEEIVPVNRTMYKLETFKKYLQSKYIQKPNYIQIHCIKKLLKKYLNYQRYRKNHVQATIQKCKKRIQQNLIKNLVKHAKNNNETLPLPPEPTQPLVPMLVALDQFTVKDNGNVPKNDVLRSNCDINKSKLLLLTNNNIKSKRNLNSTQRNHKVKVKNEVSTISSYVSEMTKNNHLKESRAFAKEFITKKRSTKSNAKATSQSSPVLDKSKVVNLSHVSSPNRIAKTKRKVSESVVESMETRNNKKRKLSFDDTLLGINRFYKQNAECDRIEIRQPKPSNAVSKSKEQSNIQLNSNILNNSKDKVRRLIIPKSKIFDGPNVNTQDPLAQIPFVKLVRDPYIDSLSRSHGKRTIKLVSYRK